MKTSKATNILIITLLLVMATTARAESVVSNVVSVSSSGGSGGEASVSTHVISTVNGETTEYHQTTEGSIASSSYVEVIIGGELGNEELETKTRALYLNLIERLLDLIELLKAEN